MKQPVSYDNFGTLRRRRSRSIGQGTAEYAIVLALVAIVAISALLFVSGGIGDVLATVSNGFEPAASGAVPTATATAKPTPTPKPSKTPKPTATPKPTKTPKP